MFPTIDSLFSIQPIKLQSTINNLSRSAYMFGPLQGHHQEGIKRQTITANSASDVRV